MPIDKERQRAFARFLWQRFIADRCPQTAGALAYTTLFALVPVTAAVLGILSAFPVFESWRLQLTDFVFRNFVPAAGDVVQTYLTQFAEKASQATAIGIVVLIFSAVSLMMSIEDAFNRIWRVQTSRGHAARFVVYWTALSLGPLLLVAALALSSYLFALPLLEQVESGLGLKTRLLGGLPFAIVWVALLSSYLLIPNRRVRLRDAALGAFVAALLFEAVKRGFALYVSRVPSYEQVYGTLAVVPIFLLWIYLSWLVVLLGASMTAAISAFEYLPERERLKPGHEFFGLLRVLCHFVDAQRAGRGWCSEDLRAKERFLTDDLLQRYLGGLLRADMLKRTEHGEWVLARNLDSVTLYEIYEAGLYRLPLGAVPDDGSRDGLPPPLLNLLDRLALDMRATLATKLSDIFPDPARSVTPSPTTAGSSEEIR